MSDMDERIRAAAREIQGYILTRVSLLRDDSGEPIAIESTTNETAIRDIISRHIPATSEVEAFVTKAREIAGERFHSANGLSNWWASYVDPDGDTLRAVRGNTPAECLKKLRKAMKGAVT